MRTDIRRFCPASRPANRLDVYKRQGEITIGDTICAPDAVEPIEFVKISAPTIEMTFSVNDSPFAGREGKFVTSRQLRDRLFRETMKDVYKRQPSASCCCVSLTPRTSPEP